MTIGDEYISERRAHLNVQDSLRPHMVECLYLPIFHAHAAIRFSRDCLEVWSATQVIELEIPSEVSTPLLDATFQKLHAAMPPSPPDGRDGMLVVMRSDSTNNDVLRFTKDEHADEPILTCARQILALALARLEVEAPARAILTNIAMYF